MIDVKIKTNTLSDQSLVHGVTLTDRDYEPSKYMYIDCISLADAIDLQDKIVNALRAHTNEDVRKL